MILFPRYRKAARNFRTHVDTTRVRSLFRVFSPIYPRETQKDSLANDLPDSDNTNVSTRSFGTKYRRKDIFFLLTKRVKSVYTRDLNVVDLDV